MNHFFSYKEHHINFLFFPRVLTRLFFFLVLSVIIRASAFLHPHCALESLSLQVCFLFFCLTKALIPEPSVPWSHPLLVDLRVCCSTVIHGLAIPLL